MRVARRLRAAREAIATAESCTGGLLAKCLTDLPAARITSSGAGSPIRMRRSRRNCGSRAGFSPALAPSARKWHSRWCVAPGGVEGAARRRDHRDCGSGGRQCRKAGRHRLDRLGLSEARACAHPRDVIPVSGRPRRHSAAGDADGPRGPHGVVIAATGRGARTLRLFFALWPDDALRTALAAATAPAIAQVAGQVVPPGNLHVTLAFLGPGTGLGAGAAVRGRRAGPLARRRSRLRAPRILGQAQGAGRDARINSGGRPRDRGAALDRARAHRLRAGGPALAAAPHACARIRRPPPENLVLAPIVPTGDALPWRLALVDSSSHPEGPRYKPIADWPIG